MGLGTDTGNSIRGPSSHNALVGIRSTMGLTSRDGIVPLYLDRDIGGPMARTVADAVAVFDVIAGYDPADPVTAASQGRRAERYADHLREDGLSGARIGVVGRSPTPIRPTRDPRALRGGAGGDASEGRDIIDPANIPEQDEIPLRERWCPRFKHDIDGYLASLGSDAPVKNLEEIIESGRYHPSIWASLDYFQKTEGGPTRMRPVGERAATRTASEPGCGVSCRSWDSMRSCTPHGRIHRA